MEIEHVKICVYLPKPQVRALQFKVHISHFLQNCKKGKPGEIDLSYWKLQMFNQGQDV